MGTEPELSPRDRFHRMLMRYLKAVKDHNNIKAHVAHASALMTYRDRFRYLIGLDIKLFVHQALPNRGQVVLIDRRGRKCYYNLTMLREEYWYKGGYYAMRDHFRPANREALKAYFQLTDPVIDAVVAGHINFESCYEDLAKWNIPTTKYSMK